MLSYHLYTVENLPLRILDCRKIAENRLKIVQNFLVYICTYKQSKNWRILTDIWMHFGVILTAFWLNFGCILTEFWWHFDGILAAYLLNFGCILTAFWPWKMTWKQPQNLLETLFIIHKMSKATVKMPWKWSIVLVFYCVNMTSAQ